ncbi:YihY/virulence factor BrkB family protein [Streptomyces sp. ISL-43]|uniref:YihY/virulence factor BrkB family protein n=1 Tax=Streptomyces sp. ISL-43 TaxID=2819183 RepID=UPI001BED0854|nr:YihY/virulence factor BrkB family protein [Streptomyces sp. ISL-43]MBT2449777.1 YihY/virulence factor BrkB family protein [Streptomyces sp. ISL-43]
MTDIPRSAASGRGRPRTAPLATRTRVELRRTAVHVWTENLADQAAALTYYAVLALLPALVIAVSLVGLLGEATRIRLITELTSYAPPQSAQALRDALDGLAAEQSSIWSLLISGVLSALWSACSYLAVFRRALHTMHRVPDTRPPLRAAHVLVINAVVLLVLLVVGALGLVVSGPPARRLAQAVGGAGADGIALLRWPVLLAVVTLLVLILFRTGPPQSRGTRRGLPGGVLAALLWLGASGLFTLYAELGTYGRLYGSLAGIVVFVIWLWFANLALLTGARFNAERAREPDA